MKIQNVFWGHTKNTFNVNPLDRVKTHYSLTIKIKYFFQSNIPSTKKKLVLQEKIIWFLSTPTGSRYEAIFVCYYFMNFVCLFIYLTNSKREIWTLAYEYKLLYPVVDGNWDLSLGLQVNLYLKLGSQTWCQAWSEIKGRTEVKWS